jgi:hypothetical protein
MSGRAHDRHIIFIRLSGTANNTKAENIPLLQREGHQSLLFPIQALTVASEALTVGSEALTVAS